jgi:hypothetical protein
MVFSALDVFGPFMRKRTVLFIVHNYGNPTPTEHGLFQPSCRGSSARLADCHQSAHCARVTWVSAVSSRPNPLRDNERAGNGAVFGVKVSGGTGRVGAQVRTLRTRSSQLHGPIFASSTTSCLISAKRRHPPPNLSACPPGLRSCLLSSARGLHCAHLPALPHLHQDFTA